MKEGEKFDGSEHERSVPSLGNTLGKKGMSESDIDKLAEYLMSFFGFTTRPSITVSLPRTGMSSTCWKRKVS